MAILRFGPCRYALSIDAPPSIARFVDDTRPDDDARSSTREVEVVFGDPPHGAHRLRQTAVALEGERRRVFLRAGADPDRALHEPLAELLARDAAEAGALLLHGAAIRVPGGVVVLTGPPSVGKTTFARHDLTRAFSGNAVCVWRTPESWMASAVPFASDPDPRLDATDLQPLRAMVELRRDPASGFEWIDAARATMVVMRRIATPTMSDPWRARRAASALDLAGSVAIAFLSTSGGRQDLELLDQCLKRSARP